MSRNLTEMVNNRCMLNKKKPCGSNCNTCGFEEENDAKLMEALHSHGLTKCSDGLYRLIVPKN